MYEMTVDLRGFEGVLRLARRYPEIFREEALAVMNAIDARVVKEVVEKAPRGVGGAGGLAGSIHGQIIEMGDGFMDRIGTPLEYGAVIELGRRPGKKRPPIAPIELWARRKLGLPPDKAKRAAWAISRVIARRGFEGRFMFKRTFDELDGWIMAQLKTIPKRVVERINRGNR